MDNRPRKSFAKSEAMLERALKVIPLGTQTFSKSHVQYPHGAAPFFIARAHGSQAWDVDGNQYTDFVNALASVTLGHCDPDVTAAVQDQLAEGTIFTLAHPLEVEVAELIVDMVPCADMVRFGKNGSDVTSGAIRAARAFTGRDRIAVCGYHGWQDWYIGSTLRNKGVPAATRELTSSFAYNDIHSLKAVLEKYRNEFAAIILEPMNVEYPAEGFLKAVVDLAHEHGALIVFDETITGFRFSLGGAQELFGVTPDLACFGKGLANGYPLAAVAGRADVMREFEEVFFSFTMGGETLSLAAAKATLQKLKRTNVIEAVHAKGKRLIEDLTTCIKRHDAGQYFTVKGHPSWSFFVISGLPQDVFWQVKTLWMQEILVRGILSVGTHNLTYAHSDADIDHLIETYDEVIPILMSAIASKNVGHYLRCKPLEPLFKLR
jgi:glutamate-1-semialdehyde 2,1-aminomutase